MTQEGKLRVRFCAKCGSLNVKPIYDMGAIDNRMECMDCNSIGIAIEAAESEREKFMEALENGGKK